MAHIKFERRHFQFLAQTLREVKPYPNMGDDRMDQWLDTVKQFAATLSGTNPGFNRAAFLKAAGIEDN